MQAWGRLTLQSDMPIMNDNIVGTMLYYTPYQTDDCSEISISLAEVVAGYTYDVFINVSLAPTLHLIQNWSGNTRLSPLSKERGLYYSQDGLLYLGSVYSIVNGQVLWQPRNNPAPGGSYNQLAVYNAYNRLPVTAICRNSNTQWEYASYAVRQADNSNLFSIYWLDGLGDVHSNGRYTCSISGSSNSAAALTCGVGLDVHAAPFGWDGLLPQGAMTSGQVGMQIMGENWTGGIMGIHSWSALEQGTPVPINVFGNNFACLTAQVCL